MHLDEIFLAFLSYFQRNKIIMAIEKGMLLQSKQIHRIQSLNTRLLLMMSMINCS